MVSITVLLTVGAFVLSVLALVRSGWRNELAWAVLFLSLVHLLSLPIARPI
jgi:hypothetical protein